MAFTFCKDNNFIVVKVCAKIDNIILKTENQLGMRVNNLIQFWLSTFYCNIERNVGVAYNWYKECKTKRNMWNNYTSSLFCNTFN